MSYFLDQRTRYRQAAKDFDEADNKNPGAIGKWLNQKKYDIKTMGISQKNKDKYTDEMIKESPGMDSWDK